MSSTSSTGTSNHFLKFPGHALHEKGLQRQIGVGTLVNSQQRRALAVPVIPRINRWSNGRFVPSAVYIEFPLCVLAKRRSEQLLHCAGGPEGRLASKATEMSAPCSAQRRPAPPSALRRADPTRPLCVRVFDSTGHQFVLLGRRSGDVSSMLLESAWKDCSLGAQFYWRAVLLDPAPPPRRASRRDPPVICPSFRLGRFYVLLRTCVFHAALLRVSSLALLPCPALLRLYFIF